MQTLNVGAGQTEAEYKESQERRREELREDSQSDAKYFFYAAALAATSSGLFAVQINFLINIGVFDLLRLYGSRFGTNYRTVFEGTVVIWLVLLCALGSAARKGHRWAFLVGLVLYGADMVALLATFSIWAFGVHGFFVLRWFQGQKALKDLKQVGT
ncbi:MAG: hypothetical protein WBV46_20345 [Terriglobales bacterium]